MSADYSSAQEHLVPRSFMFNSNDPVAVVIHKTGGDRTPQDVYNTFINSGNPGKSSHYAIGLDGAIWQFVPESLGAGANGAPGPNIEAFWRPYQAKYGNLNTCTISIEHCDPSINNDTPLTPAQKQASFNLVAHICKKHNIPPDHIKPHHSIAATTCPGTYPMQELIDFVKSGGQTTDMQTYSPDSPSFASWFSANKKGDVWTCKSNKKTVAFGILGLYKQLSVDGKSLPLPGLPVTGEMPLTIKGVKIVVQIFERMVLVYDPTHALDSQPGLEDAYIAHLDNPELLKLIPGLALPTGGVNPAIVASAKTANLAIADLFEKLGISG